VAMNQQLGKLRTAYISRPPAEKWLLAITLVVGIVWLYLSVLFDPLRAEIAALELQLGNAENRMITLQARQLRAETNSAEDPNRAARERLAALTVEERQARSQLEALTGSVVNPVAMNRLLTSVLELHPGLRLSKVENQPPRQLAGERAGVGNAQRIYRHDLLLEFEGDYLSTLSYLVYLESLSENFYWDALSVTPEEWPRSKVRLELHTLSGEGGFVGV
jgi:MSHA biogenesis protein MshJ